MLLRRRLRNAVRGFISVNAMMNSDDITAVALAVKPADLITAETGLRGIEEQLRVVLSEMREKQEIANPAFSSPIKVITGDTRDAANARIAELNKESRRLNMAATSIRQKIESMQPANANAVNVALAPFRQQAAERVAVAIEDLLAATSTLESTTAALQHAGAQATRLPEVPYLEGVLKLARAIANGRG
jgi:hypothetical protein